MVMIFQSEKALKELLDSGIVYTFRLLRSDGQSRRLGKEWFTYKRGGKKLGSIIVSTVFNKVVYPIPLELKTFVPYSGFDSVDEWINEIKKLNKPDPDANFAGELFCIHLIETNDDLVSRYINGELE